MNLGLTFVLCIIRCSINDQQYALICTTALFCITAPTCFGSSLPSSGSFSNPYELLEIQIEWVVYLKYTRDNLSVIYFSYTNHSICIPSNSEGSKKLPDDDRLLPKNVAASMQNKGVVQSLYSILLVISTTHESCLTITSC
jgi:hypothetical protein